jgi:hypothetical protein
VGVLCLALAVVAVPVVGDLSACSAAERRVFAEVPNHGGARPRPSGNAETGSCMATYRASASEDRVLAHYRQALGAGGWTVPPLLAYPGSDPEGVGFRSGELTARRGIDTTTVLHQSGRPWSAAAPMWPCTSHATEGQRTARSHRRCHGVSMARRW